MPSSPVPGRWLVVALMAATFVNFLGSLALGPFLALVAADLDTTVALVGQVPALVMFLAALLGLVIGPLADHYGLSRTLLLGVLAATVSTLAIAVAPSWAAPIWNEARVRSERFRNSSARVLPWSSGRTGSDLRPAA